MEKQNEHKSSTSLEEEEGKNLLEWTVFALSLLLVIGILGYLGYQAYTYSPSPPDLQVHYRHEPSPNAPHRYRITIQNIGGETAEEVNVEMLLEKGGGELEKVELQLPFSPRHSKREGWIIFSENPASADTMKARVVSYKKP